MDKALEKIILKARDGQVSDEETLLILIKDTLRGQNLSAFPSNIILRKTYRAMVKAGKIDPDKGLENLLVTKKMRSLSGVAVITVLTKPWPCPGECLYCPTQVDVPKSYLSSEPAVMRAILCDYDPYKQVRARLNSLEIEGHPTDKVELIVIGGTFSALPKDYQQEYIKRCFDALNNSVDKDLDDAKNKNETAKNRCVGLTLETRPDYITKEEVEWFRYLGATRVELGVQSVFDDVLKFNKRGHDVASTARATKLLKDAGFKICYHMMPNLPGSNLEKDIEMFKIIFTDPRFQPDYIKIYPCVVTKGSELYDMWKAGEYKPYSDKELEDLICEIKKVVPYYVRIMRLIRDIPSSDIEAGSKVSNMRQNVQRRLEKEGEKCKCIRCREVSNRVTAFGIKLFKEEYEASGGKEVFLSYESEDRVVLYSLLRLRLTKDTFISEIKDCALIRELHTYGQQIKIGKSGDTQHKGLGKKLISEAEDIARKDGYKKIAVISGVGVRDYYRKFGYGLKGEYMVKSI
ncbi:MAG: tRNA uridine(34) 5-carboxymethylaminomethyl modification radical SAM/GNAT enzyme Elp3 [bacterium]|nr:tRNA uridine(34) 5-carboxymethylaminomethyl modification radical SAM/GNAT enzyme Elp3 [bacterium]